MNDSQIDLYADGFSIRSETQNIFLKGLKWEYRKWEQELPRGYIFHVSTNQKIYVLILKEETCTIHIQDQTQFFCNIIVPSMVFEIVKKHILEISSA